MAHRQLEQPAEQGITLTQEQQRQVRELGRAMGVDQDLLVRAITGARLDRQGTVSNVLPGSPQELRSTDSELYHVRELASVLIHSARTAGHGLDFSTDAIARAALGYVFSTAILGPGSSLPGQISDSTREGIYEESRRRGLSPEAVLRDFLTYRLLSSAGMREAADAAVRIDADGDTRLAAMVRACMMSSRERAVGDRTEYSISRGDMAELGRTYERQVAMLTPARTSDEERRLSAAERALQRRVENWGGDYALVRDYIQQMEQRSVAPEALEARSDRNAQIAAAVFQTMQRCDLRLEDFQSWQRVPADTRTRFRSELAIAYG